MLCPGGEMYFVARLCIILENTFAVVCDNLDL